VLARSLAWMAGGQNLGKIRKYLIQSAKDTVLTCRVRYEQGEQQQTRAGQVRIGRHDGQEGRHGGGEEDQGQAQLDQGSLHIPFRLLFSPVHSNQGGLHVRRKARQDTKVVVVGSLDVEDEWMVVQR
jgi:hypothetical protein